jgi:hypothetical protein
MAGACFAGTRFDQAISASFSAGAMDCGASFIPAKSICNHVCYSIRAPFVGVG